MASSLLIMFARVPQVGRVKTRLAADVGPERACQLYEAFLDDLVERFVIGPYDFELHLTPWVDDYRRDVCRRPQCEGSLGFRMKTAFDEAFQRDYARVVLIGSDVPHMPVTRIEAAFEALACTGAGVLGATEDGGYDLVGLNGPVDVFTGIEYGHDKVLAQTVRCPLAWTVLESQFDIDTVQDLMRLHTVKDRLGPRTRGLVA